MNKEIKTFFTALTFFTRLPGYALSNPEYLTEASRYLSLVGLIVGGIGALVFWISSIILPDSIAVLFSMTSTVIITGAFHEDGFMDFCDGFGGGNTKEKILSIMKDSYVGAYAVIGIILMLALKFSSLFQINPVMLPMAIIAGHSISRFITATYLYTHKYVRENDITSKSKQAANKISLFDVIINSVFGIIPVLLLGYKYLLVFIPIFIAREAMGIYLNKKIGGFTGDCLGAIQQITEVLFYICVLVIFSWKFI